MNGFEKRTQRKKKEILETSIELFSERGIQKVSIGEIADKACVSQVTIYKYFESKDNLARYALKHYYNELIQSFIDVINSDLPYEEKIEKAFFAPMKEAPPAISAFWDDAISEKLRDITLEYEQNLTPYMLHFIEQGYECGYFDKSYSIETVLFYLNVFGTNAMKQLETIQSETKKKQIYEELLSMFLYGVVGKQTKKE